MMRDEYSLITRQQDIDMHGIDVRHIRGLEEQDVMRGCKHIHA